MKPHHWKLHLLLASTLLLLSLPLSSSQYQNLTENFSSQGENPLIAREDGQEVQSSISKFSNKNAFLLNTETRTRGFLAYENNSLRDDSDKNSPVYVERILTEASKEAGKNAQAARDLKGESEIYPIMRNEPSFGDYELIEDPREITMEKKYEDHINKMWVNFDPLRFKYFKSTDRIIYQIELSDNAQGFASEKVLGAWNEEPYEIWRSLDEQGPIRVLFYDAPESYYGSYYIRIKAFVIRDSQKIFSFMYPIGHKNLQPFRNIGMTAVGIVILVFMVVAVILSFKGLKKVGAWRSVKPGEHEAFEDVTESPELNVNEGIPSDV